MRNVVYIFILLFSFFSCSSDKSNEKELDSSDLIGKWKLTEAFISSGGPQYWVDVEDGEEFEFFENGTFTSNRYSECTSGIFFTELNELLLQYNCEEFESESENDDGFITFDLKFDSNLFIASPTSGPICIEGCSYKYQKK